MSRADLTFGASSAGAQQHGGWLELFASKKRASLVVDLACCSAIFSVAYWFLSCRKRNVIPCIRPLDLHVCNHHRQDPVNKHQCVNITITITIIITIMFYCITRDSPAKMTDKVTLDSKK